MSRLATHLARAASSKLDALSLYMPTDKQAAFLADQTFLQLAIGANRSGKSLAAAIKTAAIAQDRTIAGPNGEHITCRRPHQVGQRLDIWLIGYEWQYIGDTTYRLLFEPGAFRIIRDKKTKQWRPFKPMLPEDRDRSSESRPAPPLINPDEVDFAWFQKSNHWFRKATLHNGTVLHAYPSKGEAKAGDPADVIWADEGLDDDKSLDEFKMRLIDRNGFMYWSTLPYVTQDALRAAATDADKDQLAVKAGTKDKPSTVQYRFTQLENDHLSAHERDHITSTMSPEQYRYRILGEWISEGWKIYPQFNAVTHAAGVTDGDSVDYALVNNQMYPPDDWSIYITLDPGYAKPYVLFGAVPPPDMWNGPDPIVVVYDEIATHNQTPKDTAKAVAAKLGGRDVQRMFVDNQMGRQNVPGATGTVVSQYSREFAEVGVESVETGMYFEPGDPNFGPRSTKVRKLLDGRNSAGRPRLRVVIHRCPELVKQMQSNTMFESHKVVQEKPNQRQTQDGRSCLEYFASRDPKWLPPNVQRAYADLVDRQLAAIFPSNQSTTAGARQPFALGGRGAT